MAAENENLDAMDDSGSKVKFIILRIIGIVEVYILILQRYSKVKLYSKVKFIILGIIGIAEVYILIFLVCV